MPFAAFTAKLLSLPLLFLLTLYKYAISPMLPRACRFEPSCSDYMAQAVKTHGPLRGLMLGGKRLCRCHPWGGHGHDPVPEK